MSSPVKAAFLDRDGTLIEEQNYLNDPTMVRLFPGTVPALMELKKKGFLLFVVSNQSGVARGFITPQQLTAVNDELNRQLLEHGVSLDDAFYCVHAPPAVCACRKPGTGLIPKTWHGAEIDYSKSIVVGDKLLDLDLGKNLGARSFLVLTGYGETTRTKLPEGHRFSVVRDLAAAAAKA